MHKGRRYVLVALTLLSLAPLGQAQGPAPPPVFAAEPTPPPPPEFCPPAHSAPERMSRVPFDNLCPSGNAFTTIPTEPVNQPTWYFGVGGMFLRRTGLSRGAVAVLEPAASNPDSGNPIPTGAATALSYDTVPNPFNGGIRGTIGYYFGCNALEFTGFYLLQTHGTASATVPGQLDALFGQSVPPTGFTGSGGNIWLQADKVTIDHKVDLAGMEVNYRYVCTKGVEILGGIRYFDMREKISIFTDDQQSSGNAAMQATYAFDVHNRIVAPQLGFELEQMLVPIVSVGLTGKAAVGPNFLDVEHTLTRGDGVAGPGSTRGGAIASGIGEIGLFTNFWFNDQFRVRLGYNFLWLVHVVDAQQQINFNPNLAAGTIDNNGNQFFHGPMFEFQLAF